MYLEKWTVQSSCQAYNICEKETWVFYDRNSDVNDEISQRAKKAEKTSKSNSYKVYIERNLLYNHFNESLILAQDERWRRA